MSHPMSTVARNDIEGARTDLRDAETSLRIALAEVARTRRDWLDARRDRILTVNGELAGCPGVAWTNEERAEHDYDCAVECENECRAMVDEALDGVRDAMDRAEEALEAA